MELPPEWLCWKKLSGNKFSLNTSCLKKCKANVPDELQIGAVKLIDFFKLISPIRVTSMTYLDRY